jgi:YHS domain-containing protein
VGPRLVLAGLDPVALVEGRRVAGSERITAVRAGYEYRFADARSRERFLREPLRYAVRFGGACAKMGPLSGGGSPDRFEVYDGAIYLLASESCKRAFLADPARFHDLPDAPPTGGLAARRGGEALVARALEGLGGAKAVDAVRVWRFTDRVSYVRPDTTTHATRVRTYAFPGGLREDLFGADWKQATVLAGGRAFGSYGDTWWDFEPDAAAFAHREFLRHPVVLLASRRHHSFRAVAAGSATVGGREADLVHVHAHGATSTLAVDRATGHVLRLAYRGRHVSRIADVTVDYGDFRPVGALTLPFTAAVSLDGEPQRNPLFEPQSVAFEPRADPALFRRPR